MLTYRTNVLLDEKDHTVLSYLSNKENKTISQLIRHAIKITYKNSQDLSRLQILNQLKSLGSKVNTKNIDYKKLTHYGHKY